MGAPREYLEAKYGMHNVYTVQELNEKGFKIGIEIKNQVTITDKQGNLMSCLKQENPLLYYDFKR